MGEEKDAGIFKHSTLNVLTNRNFSWSKSVRAVWLILQD